MVNPGVVPAANPNALPRYNRSYEYDNLSDEYARFLLEEILPEVGKTYNLSKDPNDRAICGLSYCLGELPNSFIKRRLRIRPGARAFKVAWLQYLIDQGDSVAGCLVPLRLIYRCPDEELLMAAALGMAVHIGIDQLIYVIGVKSRRS